MSRHVAVIGAGVVGLATAWRLVARGHRVTIIDARPVTGATHAAAGMLAAVSEYAFEEESLLDLSVPAARFYPQIVAELAAATSVDPGVRTTPTLVVTADAADRDRLSRLRAQQQRLGLEVQALTTREARSREPLLAPGVSGAFLAIDDHQITPRRLSAAYLDALRRDDRVAFVSAWADRLIWHDGRVVGVTTVLDAPDAPRLAHRFDEHDELPDREATLRDDDLAQARVITGADTLDVDHPAAASHRRPAATAPGPEVHADEVVVANGLASPRLGGLPTGLVWPIRPVHGDVLRTRASGPLRELMTTTIRGLVHGRSVYIVPRASGTVVIGATEREDGSDAVSVGGVTQLLRDAQELVPAVAELQLLEVTARARPGTPDNAPLLGRVAPGLIANTGTHRHGVLLSAQNAVVVADTVDGTVDQTRWSAFSPWRFSARPEADVRDPQQQAPDQTDQPQEQR